METIHMRSKLFSTLLLTVVAAALVVGTNRPPLRAQGMNLDTAAIEQATGLKGQLIPEESVFKVGKPRTDVKVQVDHWAMSPFMGLGSWAAFTPDHKVTQALMMGDTVVFEDEVNPAMSAALDAGLEVTALHNHFFFDEPKVYFMHIGGHGDAKVLAEGVKKVYDKIAEVRAANPAPGKSFPGSIASPSSITAAPLEATLGTKGQANQGMFKAVIGRSATMHGLPVAKEMGINTWAAFAGSDEGSLRRRRLRHAGERVAACAAGYAQGRHQHRRHSPTHEPRAAPLLLPALLGQGQGRRSRPIVAAGFGRPGSGEVLTRARGQC